MYIYRYISELIQKEKVHIDCEKGAQINILASKIATQWWPSIIIRESKLHFTFIFYFLVIMFILCWCFDRKTGIGFNGSFSFT